MTTDTVTGWEMNRHEPPAKHARDIISFLGYIPFYEEGQSIGKRLQIARMVMGKTQAEVAKQIGVDESNLRWIELGTRKPFHKTREKIEKFVEEVLKAKWALG